MSELISHKGRLTLTRLWYTVPVRSHGGTDPGCPADFDGKGSIGASDLLALLVNWGPRPQKKALGTGH